MPGGSDLHSTDLRTRHVAVLKLGWLGPEAAPALAELKQAMLASEEVLRHDVFNTLVRIGPKAVPVLADALKDHSRELQWRAVNALLRLGPEATLAVPALADCVRNAPWYQLRIRAAMTLGRLGPLAREALPALTAAAKDGANDGGRTWRADRPTSVCEAAIGAVRRIDPKALNDVADAALPTLQGMVNAKGMTQQSVGERDAAARALALLGPHAAPALPDLRDAVLRRAVDFGPFAEACIANGAKGQKLLLETITGPGLDPEVRRWRLRVLLFQPGLGPNVVTELIRLLRDPDGVSRCMAAMILASQGPAAEPAIPVLIDGLADPALRQLSDGTLAGYDLNFVAAEALARIGPKAVPALLEALKNDATQFQAVIAVGRMGPQATDVIPALRKLLDGPPTPIAVQAAGALLRTGDDPARPLQALVAALKNVADPGCRGPAVEILACGGTPMGRGQLHASPGLPRGVQVPREAVSALLEALVDENHRAHAVMVLGAMRHAADEIVIKVGTQLRAANQPPPEYLLSILEQLGPAAKGAVPEILRCVEQHTSESTRRAAFRALQAIGPAGKDAVPVLLQVMNDPEVPGHREALWALGHIGVGSSEVLDALTRLLRDPKDGRPGRADRRSAAAWALAHLGLAAKPAVPALREALLDDDAIVRVHATTALLAAGEGSEASFRLLMLAWRDVYDPEESYPVLPHVLDGLELLGPKAADAVPRLRGMLDKPPSSRFAFDPDDSEHRAGALRALARIGPAAKAALPRLKELAAAGGPLGVSSAEAVRAIEGRQGPKP